jgi:protein-L-isoaspartate(D-aspartate) O-methyltransferase
VRPPLGALRLGALLLALPAFATAGAADPLAAKRQRMVEEVREMAREARRETGRWNLEERVLGAMARVPRHRFVPPQLEADAYLNRPLPIGHGQTISQPFIVALMTDLIRVQPGDRVLEIGTGSGYQAAVLAELAARVYTIEIIEPLGVAAGDRLRALGYGAVEVRVGDGYYGWQEHAPFDAIMVTAAASHIPPPLVQQLKPGGRMVIPVGSPFLTQHLLLVEKKPDGGITSRQVLPVRFVPLTGGH